MRNNNIVLIGMPASGKSTVGVLLAKALGIGFLDTDLLIQQQEKALLQEIIDQKGVDYFLDAESKAVCTLQAKNMVVATGGSVVLREEAMLSLQKNGTVVFLDAPLSDIEKRLHNIKTRGVAAQKGKTIQDIYEERLPLYKKYAQITIQSDPHSIEQTLCKLLDALKKTNAI